MGLDPSPPATILLPVTMRAHLTTQPIKPDPSRFLPQLAVKTKIHYLNTSQGPFSEALV